MVERNLSVRLAVIDGNRVRAELRQVGDDGQKALKRIEDASRPASAGLKLLNAGSQEARGQIEALAARAGPVGSVVGALGPAGLAAAAGIAALGIAAAVGLRELAEAERVTFRLEGVLRATGFAAGLTAGQIGTLADSIERTTFATAEQVKEAAAVLATFRSVQGDTFETAIRLAQDMSAVFGQSLASSATQLGKALEDPVRGLTALRRVGISFTASQREMIEAMVRVGDVASAQRAILETLEKQVGGAGAAETAGLAGAFDRAKESVGNFLEELVRVTGVGAAVEASLRGMADGVDALTGAMTRQQSVGTQVVAVNRKLIEAQDQLANAEYIFRNTGLDIDRAQVEAWRREVERLSAEVEALIAKGRAEVAEMEAAEAGRIAAEIDGRTEASLDRLRQLRKELEGLATPEEKIAAVREKLAQTVDELNRLRNADGSNAAAIGEAVGVAGEIARRRIEEISKGLASVKAANEAAAASMKTQASVTAEAEAVFKATRTAAETYAAEIARLDRLLAAGAISQDTYSRAVAQAAKTMEDAEKRAKALATDGLSGIQRAVSSYVGEIQNAAKETERFMSNALKSVEDALVQAAATGKLEFKSMVDAIVADLLRMQIRQFITAPLASFLGGLGNSLFGSAASFHAGGLVAAGAAPARDVPAVAFLDAPRLHRGGRIGPDEVPAILQTGERVLSRRQAADHDAALGRREAPIVLNMNVTTPDAGSFRRSQSQLVAEMTAAMERARRNL